MWMLYSLTENKKLKTQKDDIDFDTDGPDSGYYDKMFKTFQNPHSI